MYLYYEFLFYMIQIINYKYHILVYVLFIEFQTLRDFVVG